jgi:hypothetical protein
MQLTKIRVQTSKKPSFVLKPSMLLHVQKILKEYKKRGHISRVNDLAITLQTRTDIFAERWPQLTNYRIDLIIQMRLQSIISSCGLTNMSSSTISLLGEPSL